jgi:hypothetical protein
MILAMGRDAVIEAAPSVAELLVTARLTAFGVTISTCCSSESVRTVVSRT